MVTCSRLAVAVGEAIEVVVIREQTSAVVVLLGIVNDDGCVRLYSSVLMMVCSGMLAPDRSSACDVRRRAGMLWRRLRVSSLWLSRASQAAEFHLQSLHLSDVFISPSHVFYRSKSRRNDCLLLIV